MEKKGYHKNLLRGVEIGSIFEYVFFYKNNSNMKF